MQSVSDPGVVTPLESLGPTKDMSILIEDLHHFALEDDSISQDFKSAVKDFEDTRNFIGELRIKKKAAIKRLHKQCSDHESAAKLLEENVNIFKGLRQQVQSDSEPRSSAEELEHFECAKQVFEEAIVKYQEDISALVNQHSTKLTDMKNNHENELSRLREQRESLEFQIQASIEDFERRRAEVKIKHDQVIEALSEKFRARLSEIEELESHERCEAELATLRASWTETLRGLERAIGRTRDRFSVNKLKRQRVSSTESGPAENTTEITISDTVRLRCGNFPVMRECKVVLERLEIVRGSDGGADMTIYTDEVSPTASLALRTPPQSSPAPSSQGSAQRRRLFCEESVEDTLGPIEDATPTTIEGYLKSLQRIVSENTKEQKRLKRKTAP